MAFQFCITVVVATLLFIVLDVAVSLALIGDSDIML